MSYSHSLYRTLVLFEMNIFEPTNYSEMYARWGTNFHEPLVECQKQLEIFGKQGSYKLCVLMTDGEDMSHSTDDLPQRFHDRYGDCARGCSDPVWFSLNITSWHDGVEIQSAYEVKTFNDTEILAIYSGYSQEGMDALYQMSSCIDYAQDIDQCLYFTQVNDFPDLRHKTECNWCYIYIVMISWLSNYWQDCWINFKRARTMCERSVDGLFIIIDTVGFDAIIP